MLCKKIITKVQELITPPVEEIIFCYSIWQDAYEDMTNIRFHEGVIDVSTLPTDGKHRLIFLDDLQSEVSGTHNSKKSTTSSSDLFVKLSHHMQISVIFIVQELFSKSKQHRTLSLNTHYMWILKNPREQSVIMHLAKQISPYNTQYVIQSFLDATKEPYSYLFIDLKVNTDDRYRLRGDFLSDSKPPSVYVKQ